MKQKGKNPILILGAGSSIAKATALIFASMGFPLYLAGRDEDELERIAADLRIRSNVEVKIGYFDACAYAEHATFFHRIVMEMPNLEGVLLCFGQLGDTVKSAIDFNAAKLVIDSNYVGACSILTHCANYLAERKKGYIIAVTSVAGDRGKQSNYVYGSAKAGLNCYLEGLRNKLFHYGVRVITIKPGFVDTPMTFGKVKMMLPATPQQIAKGIVNSLKHSSDVIYLPRFWRYLFIIINALPECLFKRLKL